MMSLPAPAILPKLSHEQLSTPNATNASSAPSTSAIVPWRVQRRRRHTAKEWNVMKHQFVQLYIEQDKPLESVMKTLKDEHNFEAGLRQYRNKVKEWGLEKNLKLSDALILAAKKEKRAGDRGVDTVFFIRDVRLEHDRLERLVNRLNSQHLDLPSPSTTTPMGITYRTPQTNIDVGSPAMDGYELFAAQIRHHYATLASTITIEVVSETRPSSHKSTPQVTQHVHQGAGQSIVCRGQLVSEGKAAHVLWQANNLANALDLAINMPDSTSLGSRAPWSTDPSAPECWVSTKAFTISASTIVRLISHVKQRILCDSMLGFGRRDTTKWLNGWRLMEEPAVSGVEALANSLFGDPSLPYPDLALVTLGIKFSVTTPKSRPTLMRVCMAIDQDHEVRDCIYCHSTCMLLDFIDSEDAVKIHIPLSAPTTKRSFDDWTDYSGVFESKTNIGQAKWNDLTYFNQGMSEVRAGVHFTEYTKFRPFQVEDDGRICRGCHTLVLGQNHVSEQWNDAQADDDDDETDFDPYPDSDCSIRFLSDSSED